MYFEQAEGNNPKKFVASGRCSKPDGQTSSRRLSGANILFELERPGGVFFRVYARFP
jgi:hypothetical protein